MEGKLPFFIVHASDDYTFVKENVSDVLENEYNIQCKISERDFQPGKETITDIADAIKACQKTVVVLTKNSMEKQWVKYEMLLALERSQHEKFIRITALVFDDIEQKHISFGVLCNSMIVRVDRKQRNWKKLMVEELQKDHEMKETLVMANLAVGQVWSHCMGYCNNVLPDLQNKLKESSWYKNNPSRFPLVEFNIITHDAKTCRSLKELDDRIKYEDEVEIVAERGTYSTRKYSISVYSITDPESGEVYYFTCQIPNTLGIMSKLEQGPGAWFEGKENGIIPDLADLRLTPEERSMQVARFYFIMNRLLNHPKNKSCNNTTKVLQYNVSECQHSFADFLLTEIKRELRKNSHTPSTEDLQTSIGSTQVKADRDETVFIDSIEEVDHDFFIEISSFLRENGFFIWDDSRPGQTHFDNLDRATKESKWYIPLISAKSVKHPDFVLLNRNCVSLVHTSIETNELRVVPILDGINETNLPQEIGWITYLKRNETNHRQRLLNVLQQKNIPMEATVPAVDVHQGLAWAFVLNYLVPTLEERLNALKDLRSQYQEHHIYPKLFIAIPKSFKVRPLDRGDSLIDERFKPLEEEHFVQQAVAGAAKRHYQTHRFELKGNTHKYIVTVESPNALLTMKEMTEMSDISGLTEEKFEEEARKFCELSENILKVSKARDKAEFLYFDDLPEMLLVDKLLEVLENKSEWPE